jgi:hypothetical protein
LDISENNEEPDLEERIKVEVPIENEYYEDKNNDQMFAMRTLEEHET